LSEDVLSETWYQKIPETLTKELQMEAKRVTESSIVMAQQMNPQDANPAGNVHGGVIMKLIDTAAGVVATRHSRMNSVTASIDRLDFHDPVFIGDVLTLKASLNMVGRTSMEVGVRVEAENVRTGQIRRTASAYLTYVALNESGQPAEIPQLILETEDEVRRNCEAKARRELRVRERRKEGCGC
jgi:uncharacterized protein (TIGR00369 family)